MTGSSSGTEDLLRRTSKRLFVQQSEPGGLPPRIYLPIVLVIAIAFLGTIAYLVNAGFGVNGSLFGKAGSTQSGGKQVRQDTQNTVEGGPPAAVMEQLRTLRERIAAHPNDDVALTQLGDMYLASNQFAKAIPFYQRALKANPSNIAASTGLEQARSALRQ